MEVRYEELVLNTRETLERVCAHAALTFEDAMLNYYQRAPERLKEHKGRLLPNGTIFIRQEQRFEQQRGPHNRRIPHASLPGSKR